MSLHPQTDWTIPPATVEIARAAFPKGNQYMAMREHLGHLYEDAQFASLFRHDCGQSAYSPGQLALVSVMQFSDGLSDRQAAEAVRGRIEWKYALGLDLKDPGFDYSVLSEFRARLLASGRERQLFDTLIAACKSQGWLKANGKVRTDSTHVIAAIRQLNQLECVGETLRHALESLAIVVPDWLVQQVHPDWFERYSTRIESYRLPKDKSQQQALALRIGSDGYQLMAAIYATDAPPFLAQLPAVETLRQVWLQRYWLNGNQVTLRSPEEMPPHQQLIESPYDTDARNQSKRQTNWTGYSVHLSETCDAHLPHLIVNVDTTPAATTDGERTQPIQQQLHCQDLSPCEHFVDTTYISAEQLYQSQQQGITLVEPVRLDTSWQAQDPDGLDLTHFAIDWHAQQVTCPHHCLSQSWRCQKQANGGSVIEVHFSKQDCQACPLRSRCTRAATRPRKLKFKPQHLHQVLSQRRDEQGTLEFKQRYRQRAGVEGTIAQACHFGLRFCRYRGLDKTRLQHFLIATAINISRLMNWLAENPRSQTRTSHFAALALQSG